MGCYRACFMPCDSTGVSFAADAIISNPATVGNIHIAEALGIPLTMSYSELSVQARLTVSHAVDAHRRLRAPSGDVSEHPRIAGLRQLIELLYG